MWITRKKLKETRNKAFHSGFKLGFEMGQLHAMRKTMEYRKAMNGEPTSLAEKQIEAILWKAEEEEQKGNNYE